MSITKGLRYFIKRFPDDESCRKFLEEQFWPDGPECPHCAGRNKIYRYNDRRLLKCGNCKRQFQVTTGTVFQNSNVPLTTWFEGMYLMCGTKPVSSVQLAEHLGITQKSAWYIAQKIRFFLKQISVEELTGIVELDETYVGGKMRGGKPGRGSENKTPVFGMLQRKSRRSAGKLIIQPVPNAKRVTLEPIIYENIVPGTKIMTDEWPAYKRLDIFYQHKFVRHGIKEYVNGNVHVNGLEGAWSHLKRNIRGIYHRPSKKHLALYCAEFQFRYNTCKGGSDMFRFSEMLSHSRLRVSYKDITEPP